MQLKINSCGISDCAPDWKWTTAPAGFGDYDLWAVFRGIGRLSFHTGSISEEYAIREGACLLLAPDIFYTALHEPSRPLLVINVHFDFLDENGVPVRPISLPEAKSVASPVFFKTLLMRTVALFNSNKPDAASAFFLAALEEFRGADALGSDEGENIWTHIINEICEEIDSARKPSSVGAFPQIRLFRTIHRKNVQKARRTFFFRIHAEFAHQQGKNAAPALRRFRHRHR